MKRLASLLSPMAAVLLLTACQREPVADPASGEPPYSVNLGLFQREEGAEGSLTRLIPFWTSRENAAYQTRDWLCWPLLTTFARTPDTSEFFSLPALSYARADHRAGKAPARLWVCLPLLSGGSSWDDGTGPSGTQTFLPLLSSWEDSPREHDVRLGSLWDFSFFRGGWDKREGMPSSAWGVFDPICRGGRLDEARSYGWLSPLLDYEGNDPTDGAGQFTLLPFFMRWEWDERNTIRVRFSARIFERMWPIYVHDAHRGEHHILWPLLYLERAPNGDQETLFRPLFGVRRTPDGEERGFGPTIWPLERGFPSDPKVSAPRLVQPLTFRRAPDASAVNLLWPVLFHHASDRHGSDTSAFLEFLRFSRRPDPWGGEMRTSRIFPLFSSVKATRYRRTLIFPLLWGWEENDSGRYIRPLLIFKIRRGPPSWAKDAKP